MNDLIIKYAISKKIKMQALVVSIYLLLISLTLAVLDFSKNQYTVYFFVGIVGIIIAVSLILSVTISQPKPLIFLTNDVLSLNFPIQRLIKDIPWQQVANIGIGLSSITLEMEDEKVYVDLDVLRYHDLKVLKSRLIEIAEAKSIPYSNL